MSKSHFAPAVLSGLACIVASGAQAQQAPAPAESAASAPQAVVLEQVVVTSQKRREDVRKVPLSISVRSRMRTRASVSASLAARTSSSCT